MAVSKITTGFPEKEITSHSRAGYVASSADVHKHFETRLGEGLTCAVAEDMGSAVAVMVDPKLTPKIMRVFEPREDLGGAIHNINAAVNPVSYALYQDGIKLMSLSPEDKKDTMRSDGALIGNPLLLASYLLGLSGKELPSIKAVSFVLIAHLFAGYKDGSLGDFAAMQKRGHELVKSLIDNPAPSDIVAQVSAVLQKEDIVLARYTSGRNNDNNLASGIARAFKACVGESATSAASSNFEVCYDAMKKHLKNVFDSADVSGLPDNASGLAQTISETSNVCDITLALCTLVAYEGEALINRVEHGPDLAEGLDAITIARELVANAVLFSMAQMFSADSVGNGGKRMLTLKASDVIAIWDSTPEQQLSDWMGSVAKNDSWYAKVGKVYVKGVDEYIKSAAKGLVKDCFDQLLMHIQVVKLISKVTGDVLRYTDEAFSSIETILSASINGAITLQNATEEATINSAKQALENAANATSLWGATSAVAVRSAKGQSKMITQVSDQITLAEGGDDSLSKRILKATAGIIHPTMDDMIKGDIAPYLSVTGLSPLAVNSGALMKNENFYSTSGDKASAAIRDLLRQSYDVLAGHREGAEGWKLNARVIFNMLSLQTLADDTIKANIKSGSFNTVTSGISWSNNVKDALSVVVSPIFAASSVICANYRRSYTLSGALGLAYLRSYYNAFLRMPEEVLDHIIDMSQMEDVTVRDYLQKIIGALDDMIAAIEMSSDDRELVNALASCECIANHPIVSMQDNIQFNIYDFLGEVVSTSVYNQIRQLTSQLISLENTRADASLQGAPSIMAVATSVFGSAASVKFANLLVSTSDRIAPDMLIKSTHDKAFYDYLRCSCDSDFNAKFKVVLDLKSLLDGEYQDPHTRATLPHNSIAGVSNVPGYDSLAHSLADDVYEYVKTKRGVSLLGGVAADARYSRTAFLKGSEIISMMRLNVPKDVSKALSLEEYEAQIPYGRGTDMLQEVLALVGLDRASSVTVSQAHLIRKFVNSSVLRSGERLKKGCVDPMVFPFEVSDALWKKNVSGKDSKHLIALGDFLVVNDQWFKDAGYVGSVTVWIVKEDSIKNFFTRYFSFGRDVKLTVTAFDKVSGHVLTLANLPMILLEVEGFGDARHITVKSAGLWYRDIVREIGEYVYEFEQTVRNESLVFNPIKL